MYSQQQILSKQSAANTVGDIRSLSAPQLFPHPGGKGMCQIAELFWGTHCEAPFATCAGTHTHTTVRQCRMEVVGRKHTEETHSRKVSEPVTR